MKPIKSPSRATALLIKKAKRKHENDITCNLIWPRHFSRQNSIEPPKI